MVTSRADTVSKEKERLVKEIINWSRSDEKVLNIVTVPYSKCDIFEELIYKCIREERTILFIANDNDGIKCIVDILKGSNFTQYSCSFEGMKKVREDKPLVITTVDNALSVQKNYYLVIYDDINSLSKYSKFEMLDLLSYFYKTSRIICRSMEAIFQNAQTIDIPLIEKGMPIIEPRIITTRLDLNREIPTVIYDYLKWSISCRRNVVVLTPDDEISTKVHEYLLSIKEDLSTSMLLYSDTRSRELQYFLDKIKGIIVTHNIDILKMRLSNTDFIVYFAESRVFECKKLVFICSKVSSAAGENLGEVILLSNDISRDMESSKDIIRGFNKQIWDMGLLGS